MNKKNYLTLQLNDDLREEISYHNHTIPFSICIDSFDDYWKQEWTSHWHDEYEFNLVLEGKVTFTIYTNKKENVTVTLEKGDGIFINTNCLHSAKAICSGTKTAGAVFSNAFFNIKPFETVLQDLLQPIINFNITHIKFHKEEEKSTEILTLLYTLSHLSTKETGYMLHCMELVFKLWRLLLVFITLEETQLQVKPIHDLKEQRLKELLSYIHAHYGEHITIEDMIKHTNISRTECFRCFQSILSKTPIQYLTDYRLSIAAMLLVTTQRPLSDIIYSCGFHNPSYFGKLFKEQYGTTPKKYRNNLSKKSI